MRPVDEFVSGWRCAGPGAQEPTCTPPGKRQSHVCESRQPSSLSETEGPPVGHAFPVPHLDEVHPRPNCEASGYLALLLPTLAPGISMQMWRPQGLLTCWETWLQVWAQAPTSGTLCPLEAQACKEEGCCAWSCHPRGLGFTPGPRGAETRSGILSPSTPALLTWASLTKGGL